MDILPIQIATRLCSDCVRDGKCANPRIRSLPDNGVTCLDYDPAISEGDAVPMTHIMALPDRKPCDECACRKSSQAGQTPHTQALFKKSVKMRAPFLCHGSGAGRVCAGWLRAAKVSKK